MKMWSKMAAAVAMLVIVMALAACGGGASEPAASESTMDAESLVNDRCTQCHGIERVTQAQKTQAQWQSTVTGMVAKGAKLSADEQMAVVAYLAEKYAP